MADCFNLDEADFKIPKGYFQDYFLSVRKSRMLHTIEYFTSVEIWALRYESIAKIVEIQKDISRFQIFNFIGNTRERKKD